MLKFILGLIGLVRAKDLFEYDMPSYPIHHLTTEKLSRFRPYTVYQRLNLYHKLRVQSLLCFSSKGEKHALGHLHTADMNSHHSRLGEPDQFTFYLYEVEVKPNTLLAYNSSFGMSGIRLKLYFVHLWLLSLLGVKYAVDVPMLQEQSIYGYVFSPLKPQNLDLKLVKSSYAEESKPYFEEAKLS